MDKLSKGSKTCRFYGSPKRNTGKWPDAFAEKDTGEAHSSHPYLKGQAVSGDFVISIIIFLVAMVILLPTFDKVSIQARLDDERRDLEIRSLFASDAFVKSQGYPADWNSTTVKAVGLSDSDGKLDLGKIKSFLNLSYGTARDLLGITGFGYNISFYDINNNKVVTGAAQSPAAYFYVNNNDLGSPIKSSGIVWDLYYGGGGQPNGTGARYVYTGTKAGMLNSMTANRSIYKTIIIEEPELTQAQVNIDDLKDFVADGGVLIFEGSADLLQTGFSMSSGTDPGGAGFVNQTDNFLDAGKNETVQFSSSNWYFYRGPADAPIKVIVSDTANPGAAFMGRWNHGIGTIYYVTDVSGSINSVPLAQLTGVAGKAVESGVEFSSGSSVSVTQRFGIINDRNQPVKIIMLVWK